MYNDVLSLFNNFYYPSCVHPFYLLLFTFYIFYYPGLTIPSVPADGTSYLLPVT